MIRLHHPCYCSSHLGLKHKVVLQITRHQKGTLNASGMTVLGCHAVDAGMIKWPSIWSLHKVMYIYIIEAMLRKSYMTAACITGSSAKVCS